MSDILDKLLDSIVLGVCVTGSLFIGKEALGKIINKDKHKEDIEEVTNIGIEKFEEKKLVYLLSEAFKICNKEIDIGHQHMKQGDSVSFETVTYGEVTGTFIGVKQNNAEGYTYNFILKTDNNKIISAPVDFIVKDSVRIFSRCS